MRCLLVGVALASWSGCTGEEPATGSSVRAAEPAREYVGAAACATCHEAEHARWQGSHHDRAMELPTPESILADLSRAPRTHAGQRLELLHDEASGYVVQVRGEDGEPERLPLRYTFGFEPLQQYLVDVGRGRLQALTLAWDARPAAEGGQRWLDLHADEPVGPGDRLHWRSAAYSWNAMCADCHSTGVERGYQPDADRYETTYAEIDVACEACHGPGSEHVAWADARAAGGAGPRDDRGLSASLRRPDARRWVLREGADIAHRVGPAAQQPELEVCAPCHARRADLGPADGDASFDDRYRLALIEEPLYFADGQIREEVFVYGSFLQSRMFARGVVCSDCHDPHALSLRAEGNALCATCHRPARFDTSEHHFHEPGSEAARCVSCHMPATTYMRVDARRDHRFGLPAPALAERVGSPDVCTPCHTDHDPAWAQAQIERRRRGPAPERAPGDALWRAWQGQPHAQRALLEQLRSPEVAPIVRASALAALSAYPSPQVAQALRSSASAASPLVRRAAAGAARSLPPAARWDAIRTLLRDPVRSVRIEAAGALMGVREAAASAAARHDLERAEEEWVAARRSHRDRAEALVDLAYVAQRDGATQRSETLLRRAIERDPSFSPAHLNLADLYRARGDEARAVATLRAGMERAADRPMLEHALGLALVRSGERSEALEHLASAAAASPDRPRLAYVHAVALFDGGDAEAALDVLRALHERRPGDRDVLSALADYAGRAGHPDEAARYTQQLRELLAD